MDTFAKMSHMERLLVDALTRIDQQDQKIKALQDKILSFELLLPCTTAFASTPRHNKRPLTRRTEVSFHMV